MSSSGFFPRIAITMGDPAGIGPEICLRLLTDARANEFCVIAQLIRRHAIATVCIEGGATAAALLRYLQWTRLTALPASGLPGVAILRPIGASLPQILIKPGSYPWPEKLWRTSL